MRCRNPELTTEADICSDFNSTFLFKVSIIAKQGFKNQLVYSMQLKYICHCRPYSTISLNIIEHTASTTKLLSSNEIVGKCFTL